MLAFRTSQIRLVRAVGVLGDGWAAGMSGSSSRIGGSGERASKAVLLIRLSSSILAMGPVDAAGKSYQSVTAHVPRLATEKASLLIHVYVRSSILKAVSLDPSMKNLLWAD